LVKKRLLIVVVIAVLSSFAAAAFAARPLKRTSVAVSCRGAVSWRRAVSLEGRVATLSGRVASTKFAASSSGSPTFLDVGNPYPNPNRLSLVIWIEDRLAFGRPEIRFRGHTICVRGLVSDYDGSPEIVLRSPSQIRIKS
jgi:hypothetical protein